MRALRRLSGVLGAVAVGALLPISASQAATYFYHTDHLGTPQALTDKNQQVIWQSEQEPFGEVTATTNAVEQNLRFPGQYYDVETGLHYNYFRDYDAGIGRYVQSDPIGLAGGASTYSYVGSNPLSYYDPLGLARFGFRPLDKAASLYNAPDGRINHHAAHEQLWFDDIPSDNVGFFQGDGSGKGWAMCGEAGDVRPDIGYTRSDYDFHGRIYDDQIMRQALANVSKNWDFGSPYCLIGRNCQHFSDALRSEYDRLENPPTCRLTSRGTRCN